jgi:hypothetical protein
MNLRPKPGFNPMLLTWGGPDEPVAEACSYCDEPIGEDDVPLIMWREDGWTVRFCTACQEVWFGFQCFEPRRRGEHGENLD